MDNLSHLEAQVKIVDEKVREVDHKLSRMLMMLTGNELDKNDNGFIGQVDQLEKRVKDLEKFRDRAIYLIIGASLTTGFGVGKVIELILAK
jgi:hypothetical protein